MRHQGFHPFAFGPRFPSDPLIPFKLGEYHYSNLRVNLSRIDVFLPFSLLWLPFTTMLENLPLIFSTEIQYEAQ